MSDTTSEALEVSGSGRDARNGQAHRETPAEPLAVESRSGTRLTAARRRLGHAAAWASEKAAPLIDGIGSRGAPIRAALAGVVAAVVVAWRRRRGGDPVIDESIFDQGYWHAIGDLRRTKSTK